jgi:NADPH:quinone reductase-like Zn-dependent oxidoreductase
VHAALVAEAGRLEYRQVADPSPPAGWVVVELRAAALNRRDLAVIAGRYPEFPLPLIPGSDGAGILRDNGDEVVILPSLGWGTGADAPAPGWRILGGPEDGTWAELVAVPAENVYPKPSHLSWFEAAAFPLAGLTAWRALFTRGGLRAGETVLVLGAGSGVSTFLVQLAHRAGARVLVTSSADAKIARAVELGAERGIRYDEDDWAAELQGEVDLCIDSVGATWPDALRTLRPGGRLVVFGATRASTVELPIRHVYWNQLSILGTTMGSRTDFEGLLHSIGHRDWLPAIDSVHPLEDARSATERLAGGEQFGKVVLAVS